MKAKKPDLSIFEQRKIVVVFGPQREGHTFRLDPRSLWWIQVQYPERHRVASVFIGFDERKDIQSIDLSVFEHVVTLLTGLSIAEINEAGGFSVANPVTEQEVFNFSLVHA